MAAGLSLSEEFIALFNNLKEASGNSPERLAVFYKDSKAVHDALHALHAFLARTDLERRVFHGQKKIVILRAAGFEDAWSEYDSKWRFRTEAPGEVEAEIYDWDDPELPVIDRVTRVTVRDIVKLKQIEPEPSTRQREPEAPDPEVEDSFDPLRHDGRAAINLGIDELQHVSTSGLHEGRPTGNACNIALGAFYYLEDTIGLDIGGVFRRWRRVPVVFKLAHVSNRYGASDKSSLLHLLDDAVRAYVFGAPAAAIAMCRTALERVLKRHYGRGQWDDEKLVDLIDRASCKYPKIVQKKDQSISDIGK